MITGSVIRNRFKEFLPKVAQEIGVTFKPSTNEIITDNTEIVGIMQIQQTSWSDHHSLDVKLMLRHKGIEAELRGILKTSDYPNTFWADLGVVYRSIDGRAIVRGNMRILVYVEADIEAAIETLKYYWNEIAEPYFSKYSNLSAIDAIMNTPPFEYIPAHVGSSLANRCIKGIIAAHLAKRENINELISIYDTLILKTESEDDITNYNLVKESLISRGQISPV